jgi:SAM-dependent methyltransferase
MINIARTHVDGVEFLVNESASLSQFKENSIDFVYSHIVLQHMPNEYQKRYIDEFLRVLRPGGLAVFQIPVDIVHKLEMSPSLAYFVKRKLKEWLPVLVSIKRALVPAKKFHNDFRYEMHSLSDAQIRCICDRRGCVIKAAPATNSCEPDHNGRVEFFDIAAHRKLLEASQLPNRYLSCMYFVSKPFPSN